jgi:hypothetical protein
MEIFGVGRENFLAKVEVGGSNPLSRSRNSERPGQKPGLFFCNKIKD